MKSDRMEEEMNNDIDIIEFSWKDGVDLCIVCTYLSNYLGMYFFHALQKVGLITTLAAVCSWMDDDLNIPRPLIVLESNGMAR